MQHSAEDVSFTSKVGVDWITLRSRILRFIQSKGVACDDVEDLANDTIHVVLQRYRSDYNTDLEQGETIRLFAFGVADRLVKRQFRAIRNRARFVRSVEEYEEVEDLMKEVADAPDKTYMFKEADKMVRRAMDTLSEKHRLPFYLRYCKNQSIREIADLLNLPSGTVKKRLFDARRKLEVQLQDLIR